MLAGEELLDAIEDLYARHPGGDDAPSLSYVDGALAGLLLAPEPLPPEEWLFRLGAGPEIPFSDPADGDRLAGLLQARQAEMEAQLLEGEGDFAPVYQADEEGRTVWQLWLLGLGGALMLFPHHWAAMIGSDDEDVRDAAGGLVRLLGTLPGFRGALADLEVEQLDDIEEMAGHAEDLVPLFVEILYRRQRGLDLPFLSDPAPQVPVRSVKIGRNEPCPCGSGKKYKKCCGG